MAQGKGWPVLDEELAGVVRRAVWLGKDPGGGPMVSFTSLWLALLVGGGPTCRWLQDAARELGLRVDDVVARWRTRFAGAAAVDEARLEEARGLSGDALPSLSPEPRLTPSARAALDGARDLASRVQAARVSVRHLIAAYVYRVTSHLDDYQAWKLDREVLAARLLEHLADRHADEVARWRTIHLDELDLHESPGPVEILRWAEAFRAAREPGEPAITPRILLAGLVLDGVHHHHPQYATTWLAEALGESPLALLGLEALPTPSSWSTPLSRAAEQVLARAAAIATLARPTDRAVRSRHIVAALLSRPLDGGAADLVHRAGTTSRALRAKFHDWPSWTEPPERAALLRAISPAGQGEATLAGYANDEARGDDRLDLGREVNALAAVLASTQIDPPLSVGLFGDWGTGKSFFMNLLGKRIDELAGASREARKAGQASAFCSEVVQIGFNAWQYMDGNLWASLVTHIFDELNRTLRAQDKPTVETYAAELDSVRERTGELERERSALASEVTELDARIQEKKSQRESRRLSLSEAVAAVAREQDEAARQGLDRAARELGLDAAALSVERAREEKVRLGYLAGRFAAWWRVIRSSPPRAALAACFAILPLALVALGPALHWLAGVLAPLAALLVEGVAVLHWVRSRIAPAVRHIDDALARADRAEEAVRAQQTEEERRLRSERERLAGIEADLERERQGLAQRQRAIEAELQALREGRSFHRFVLERAASQDYRRQRGLIADVHRDFKTLSERLGDSSDPHVDRIVLYIDDLDRCPPERVVEVLQAIHLLLSLRLFVVIVAVDSRWLLRSLDAYYARQFHGAAQVDQSWESKPQHYLEKIFQIPFALPPMGPRGFGDLVTSLLGGAAPDETPAQARARTPRGSDAQFPAGSATLPRIEEGPTSAAVAVHSPAGEVQNDQEPAATATTLAPVIDLTPRNLEVDPAELAHLKTLAPMIASPRAAKRLVNLYRIIRASLNADELEEFLAGRYRIVQLLLAAVIDCPSASARLFQAIFSGEVSCRADVRAFMDRQDRADPQWTRLASQIADRGELADWEAIRHAAHIAGRYSFEAGRLRPAPRPAAPAVAPTRKVAAPVVQVGPPAS